MTLTEVIKIESKKPVSVEKQKLITKFFQKDYFEWVNFDRRVAEATRKLIWQHAGLKSKDAVHIASALEVVSQGVELDAVHSYDSIFAKLSGKVEGISCPMEEPIPKQLTMPLGDERRRQGKKRRKKSR